MGTVEWGKTKGWKERGGEPDEITIRRQENTRKMEMFITDTYRMLTKWCGTAEEQTDSAGQFVQALRDTQATARELMIAVRGTKACACSTNSDRCCRYWTPDGPDTAAWQKDEDKLKEYEKEHGSYSDRILEALNDPNFDIFGAIKKAED